MAIARRAVGTAASAQNGAIAPGIPAGNAADDILICSVVTGGTQLLTFPAGWTIKIDQANGSAHRWLVAWLRAVGGESAPSITGATQDVIARIVSYSGCVTTGDPFNAANSQSNASSATLTAPSITPAYANSMVVFLGCWTTTGAANPTFSAYSGSNPTLTESIDNAFVGGTVNAAICGADGLQTGASSTGAVTATSTDAEVNCAALLALTDSAAGGPQPDFKVPNQFNRSYRPAPFKPGVAR